MAWASPLLAAAATLVAGFVLFSRSARIRSTRSTSSSSSPSPRRYGVGELLLKATPLMLIARRPRGRLSRQRLEHRRRRPAHRWARSAAAAWRCRLPAVERRAAAAADDRRRRRRRHALGRDPGVAAHALQRQRDSRTSLMLVYVAALALSLAGARTVARSRGLQLSAVEACSATARCCRSLLRRHAAQRRLPARARGRRGRLAVHAQEPRRISACASRGSRRAARTTPASPPSGPSGSACWSAARRAGIAGVGEVAGPIGQLLPSMSPGYGFAAIIVAFVGRLHPLGICSREPADVAALPRRRSRRRSDWSCLRR